MRRPEPGNQRLPLQLLAHPGINGKIILPEPRRLAARNVAQRLAELLNESRDTVGYRMRAQNCVGPNTRTEVVTEGVLTRMIQRDPELSGVGLVILMNFMSAACRRIWRWRCYSMCNKVCVMTLNC